MNFRSTYIHHVYTWTWVLCLAFASIAEASKQLYRYRNVDGVVVVDYQVPTHSIAGGYEVLNHDGTVIKVVPRALTPEEKKTKDAEKTREQAAMAEQERLRAWDQSLMLRYSTTEDIEDARKRGLGDLQIRVSILKSNRRSLKQRVENYQIQAAGIERSGMTVGVDRLRAIDDLQGEIDITDRAIAERQIEKEELAAGFAADIERFEMLQEAIVLRRTLSDQRAR